MTEAYPLAWPSGRPRTQYPQQSRFGTALANARDSVLREIRLLGGTLPVISSDLLQRQDGLPLAKQAQPHDKGVAVYFSHKKQQMCFACDRWQKVEDNLLAVAKTIEALRGIERWGTGDMVQQAFTGFVALPAPSNHWDALGLKQGASRDDIEAAYRDKAKSAHPDAGGSHDQMARLNAARDELLRRVA